MLSSSDLFIQQREQDVFEGIENFKRNEVLISEYKNGKAKHVDSNEESDLRREREMEDEPFANDLYEREEGL
jgi:hypothetical protein